MENRSFEGEPPCENPPNDPKGNSPGSIPRENPSGDGQDQSKDRVPPLARITDDEADESPPAYVKRYMQEEQKIDNYEDLDVPPPEPVQETHDVRSDPEFLLQAKKRRERRERQRSVRGPCSLRPDPPSSAPLSVPEPYPDPDIGQQPANAPDPDIGQQPANAPDPEQQPANAPDSDQQPANVPAPKQQPVNIPDSVQQTVSARTSIRDRCASIYKQINGFTFQFPFHTLLLTWPLATGIMGVMNLLVCNLNRFFPGVMIFVGFLGTVTTLLRLYAIYSEKRFTSVDKNLWIVIRTTELIIWVLFSSQLFYFFEQNPSFTPGDKHYCKQRFYRINCGLMFLTSATMIGWIIVNVGNLIYWFSRSNERPRT